MNKLWIFIVLYVSLIYLSLSQMRRIIDFINANFGREMLSVWINLLILLTIVIILTYMKSAFANVPLTKVSLFLIVLVCALFFIQYFAPEERVHLFQYGFLGFLCMKALGGMGWRTICKAITIVAIVGIGDELIQYFLPTRVGDCRDVGLNVVCGLPGVLLQNLMVNGEQE